MAFSKEDSGFEEFERHGIPQLDQQPKRGERRAYGLYNENKQSVVFADEYSALFRRTVGEGRKLQGDLFKRELLGEEEARGAWEIICVVVDKDLNVRIEETDGIVSKDTSQQYLRRLARRITDYIENSPRLNATSGSSRIALGLAVSGEDLNHTLSSTETDLSKGDLVVVAVDNGEFLWGRLTARDGETYAVDLGQSGERLVRCGDIGVRQEHRLDDYVETLINRTASAFDLARARVHSEHTFQKGEVVIVRRNDGSFRYGQVFGESPTVDSYLVVVTETRDWKDVPINEIGKLVDSIPVATPFLTIWSATT